MATEILPRSADGKYRCERRGVRGIIQVVWLETREVNGRSKSREQSKSLGTASAEEADKLFATFILELGNHLKDIPLRDCIQKYWDRKAQHLDSAHGFLCSKDMVDEFAPPDMSVKRFTLLEQEEFVARARAATDAKGERRFADSTILRTIGCIFASIRDAHRREWITADAIPPRLPNDSWEPDLPNRERELTPEEVGKLFTAAFDQDSDKAEPEQRGPGWWRALILLIATVARPSAATGVESIQVDRKSGTINLLPPGKKQHKKKKRAIIKMCPTLAYWVSQWEDGPYVKYQGRKLLSLRFFATLSKKAGVDCSAYDFRHTLATWMLRMGVPDAQRKMMMGQALDKGAAKDYLHMRPEYCAEAAAAIEKFFEAVSPFVQRPLTVADIQGFAAMPDQPLPDDVDLDEFCVPMELVARQVLGKSGNGFLAHQALENTSRSLSGTEQS